MELIGISPGDRGMWRAAWRSGEVFAPPPWEFFDPVDGTFGNRFDDPGLEEGIGADERYRMIYCATERIEAFMESAARFRRSLSSLRNIGSSIEDPVEGLTGSLSGLYDPDDLHRGLVPAEWRLEHHIGHTRLGPSLRFVDIAATGTLNHLRAQFADELLSLGLDDIDLSVVTGPHRKLTQRIARYVYEQTDAAGTPRFAGIRYLSHYGDYQECWAIFDTRMAHEAVFIEETIRPDDADLLTVARLFDLTIEVMEDRYLRP